MHISTIDWRDRSGKNIVAPISRLKLISGGLRIVRSLGAVTFLTK